MRTYGNISNINENIKQKFVWHFNTCLVLQFYLSAYRNGEGVILEMNTKVKKKENFTNFQVMEI